MRNDNLGLADRAWECMECGTHQDREEKAATKSELAGPRLLAGSGYLGVTPVQEKAPADISSSVIPYSCETGPFSIFLQKR